MKGDLFEGLFDIIFPFRTPLIAFETQPKQIQFATAIAFGILFRFTVDLGRAKRKDFIAFTDLRAASG